MIHFDSSGKLYPREEGLHSTCSDCKGRIISIHEYDARIGEACCLQCHHARGHVLKASTCSSCSNMLRDEQLDLWENMRRLQADCFCGNYTSLHACIPIPLIAQWDRAYCDMDALQGTQRVATADSLSAFLLLTK